MDEITMGDNLPKEPGSEQSETDGDAMRPGKAMAMGSVLGGIVWLFIIAIGAVVYWHHS